LKRNLKISNDEDQKLHLGISTQEVFMGNRFSLQVTMFLLIVCAAAAVHAAPLTLHECLTEALSNNPLLKEGKLGIAAE